MLKIGDCKAFYVLSAKGIQSFILKGNRLRFMVGGSELVQQIPDKFLGNVLGNLGLKVDQDYRFVSRAAGRARILFRDEAKAKEVAKVVPLALNVFAPGLDAVQTVEPIDDVPFADIVKRAEVSLGQRRQLLHADYPVAGPLVERTPRSGLPTMGYCHFGGKDAEREPADRIMSAKNEAAKPDENLARRVLPKHLLEKGAKMAMDFSDIGDDESIAVVHIDGNGLGKAVQGFLQELQKTSSDEACSRYEEFSKAVDQATCEAVQAAFGEIPGSGKLPFRALVCAGDDVTVVLRAADAVGFVSTFLKQFEENTRNKFSNLGLGTALDKGLTACAGIVFCKHSFPFGHAYELCESLCKFAKEQTNRAVSAMAFWRQTATIADDFKDDIMERDLKGADGLTLTMMPYVLGGEQAAGHPMIEDLLKLKGALSKMPRGSMRGILADLYQSRKKAQQSFERVCQIAQGKTYLSPFLVALKTLTQNQDEPLFKPDSTSKGYSTPLYDAMELIAAERKHEREGAGE
jgi:hypothetical protein